MALAARADAELVVATACFAGNPSEVCQAREFVRGVLGENCPVLDDVLLMVSEIASNAVRHTASARENGWFDLTVCRADGTIRIAVGDQGSASGPQLADSGDGSESGTAGRGLRIVNTLSRRWGHAGDDKGRVVWFEMNARNRR